MLLCIGTKSKTKMSKDEIMPVSKRIKVPMNPLSGSGEPSSSLSFSRNPLGLTRRHWWTSGVLVLYQREISPASRIRMNLWNG